MENRCCLSCTCFQVNPHHNCCHVREVCSNCLRTMFEIKELPRAISLDESKKWYGDNWEPMEQVVGKINELVSELNKVKRKLDIS